MQPSMMGKSIIQLNIPDRATLQASYMSFVQGGALFIPSKQQISLGEEVFVIANLPEQSQRIPLRGKVIWITRKQTGFKPQGFAFQLCGEKGAYYKNEVEKLLAGSSQDRPNYTM